MMDSLSERLGRDVQIFDSLLKLIPAKFYVMDKTEEMNNSKFQHNKRKKAPKQAVKDATKKAKKAKLDPTAIKSIEDLQAEKAKALAEEKEQEEEEVEEESESDSDAEDETQKMEVESGAFSGLEDDASVTTESTTTQEDLGKIQLKKFFFFTLVTYRPLLCS